MSLNHAHDLKAWDVWAVMTPGHALRDLESQDEFSVACVYLCQAEAFQVAK